MNGLNQIEFTYVAERPDILPSGISSLSVTFPVGTFIAKYEN